MLASGPNKGPCSKCGDSDIPKHWRFRKGRPQEFTIYSYCRVCHYEDLKVCEARRYDKKLAYNRAWRKNNRSKVNEIKRRAYWKERGKKYADLFSGSVSWFKEKGADGFSHMTYTPTIFLGMEKAK